MPNLNFNFVCQELREAIDLEAKETGRDALLLTAAVAAGKDSIDAGYEMDKLGR